MSVSSSPSLNILFILASPSNRDPLDVSTAIESAVRETSNALGHHQSHRIVFHCHPASRSSELMRFFSISHPVLVHFYCYADDSGLSLLNSFDESQSVSQSALANLFTVEPAQRVQVVLLTGGDSQAIALSILNVK